MAKKSATEINQEAETYFQYGLQDERFLQAADKLLSIAQDQKKFYHNYVNRLEVLIDLERIVEAKQVAEEFLEHTLLYENKTKQDVARKYLDKVDRMISSQDKTTASG